MPVVVRYVDRTPTTATVLAIITEPNGICQASGRLLPSGVSIGTPQSYGGCPTTAVWEVRNVLTTALESQTPHMDASTCTNDPDRGRAQSDCRARLAEVVSGDGEPYLVMPVTGPRVCPPRSMMTDCALDRVCADALAMVNTHFGRAEEQCQRIRDTQRVIDRLEGAIIAFAALVVALFIVAIIAIFFAPSAVTAIGYAITALIVAIIAMATALGVLSSELSSLRGEHRNLLAIRAAALQHAQNVCTCPDCGVPPRASQLPSSCS